MASGGGGVQGLVVLFPEPLNQKAEAVMISRGLNLPDYMSVQLESSDFAEDTLVLTFDQEIRGKVMELEGAQNVYVLTDVTAMSWRSWIPMAVM